ncbi:MAG: hypothetical protein LWW95_08310 [Candidatus Desulfofervidus auxilii]|nr:hypothetical protein [Candidatus Desulfofervidus auxilii]
MRLFLVKKEDNWKLYMEYESVRIHGLKEEKVLELITEGTKKECESTIRLLKKYFEVEVIKK